MTTVQKQSDRLLSLVPIESFEKKYSRDIHEDLFFGFPLEPILRAEESLLSKETRSIAYFSMEFGLSSNTYNALERTEVLPKVNLSPEHHVFSNLRAMDYYLELHTNYRLDLPIYSGGMGA